MSFMQWERADLGSRHPSAVAREVVGKLTQPRHLIRKYGDLMRRLGRLDIMPEHERDDTSYRQLERQAGAVLHEVLGRCKDHPITPEESEAIASGNND